MTIRKDTVGWILHNACTDINYDTTIPELTNEELEYCLIHEDRKTGQRKLQAERKRREKR